MNKRILLCVLILFLIGTACKTPALLSPKPKTVQHPDPKLRVEAIPFEGLGCEKIYEGMYNCPEGNPLREMGCESLRPPDSSLGGLQPAAKMLACHSRLPYGGLKDERMLYNDGCMMPIAVRLLIQRGDTFQVIHDLDELQAAFAPVESPEEALSYAVAATGFSPWYDVKVERSYRYFVKTLEDTRVQETPQGYRINLYYYQVCGCGPHTTSMVEVLVGQDGSLQKGEFIPVMENPEEDGLCVD